MYDLDENVISWLLDGDVSIAYLARRDLLDDNQTALRNRIATEGWGKAFLLKRNSDGSWGQRFYQPKWTSSHYTLLDLKNLQIDPKHALIRESIQKISREEAKPDGGIGPGVTIKNSDVCVNGMFLNYASYFGETEKDLRPIVDFLISQHMNDGGFNCCLNQSGAHHSSLHSTISVMEGIQEYRQNGYGYRADELQRIAIDCREFILLHHFFKSDHTGEVIQRDFLKLTYPWRWKYNILRALLCFVMFDFEWDERMRDAMTELLARKRADGRWPHHAAHSGQVHFKMEEPRQLSRWNTLFALRVFKKYGGNLS